MSELIRCTACLRSFNPRFLKCPFCNAPNSAASLPRPSSDSGRAVDYRALADKAILLAQPFVPLEYHPAAVLAIDCFFDQTFGETGLAPDDEDWKPSKIQYATVIHFGAFFGEVMLREFGGRWSPDPELPEELVNSRLLIPGDVKVFPMARVYRRLKNGRTDSLEGLYRVIRSHRGGGAPQEVEGWSRYADRFAGLGRPDLALGFVDNALQLPLSAPDRSRLQVQRLLLTKAAEKAEKEAQEAEARETRPASAPVEPPRPVQPVSQNAPDSLSAALQALSQQALELSNQGKQAEVLVTFERMLELSPSNPEALIGKAAAMLALGATAPALKFLDRLKIRMDLEPRRTYLEGLGAEQAGEYVRAVKALRSIVTSPRLSEAQRALAAERVAALSERVDVMLASIEDIPDVKTAVEAYARLLVLHPKVAEAHRERGVGLAMLGRNGEALSCFDRAIALEPTEPKSYDHRAVTLLRIQQFDDVLKTLEQGIRHCPNSGQLHCRRGICLNMLGRKVDALAAFVRSLEVDPAHLDAWAYRGEVEAQLGRTRDAMVSLEKFLALRPSGEHKLVVAARRQLFALENPGRVPDEEKGKQLQRQALASAALGRIQDASDQLEAALRANPLSGELWCNRGTVLQQLDQPGEALVAFEMAEKLQGPISSVVRGEVACLSRLGRLDAALKCLDRELEATPLAEEAQRAKAMLLFRMGRSSESLEVYQLLVMRHPERVDFLAERAGVLEAVGKLPEARFGYEAALALSPASSELRSAVERLRQAER